MANNEELNGEDFSQDVNAGEDEQQHLNGEKPENGDSASANGNNGSAEAPGRDDDRYVHFYSI